MREIEFRAYCPEKKYMAYQGTPDLETFQKQVYNHCIFYNNQHVVFLNS